MTSTSDPKIKIFPDGRMDTANTATYSGYSEKTLAMFRCNGKGPKFIKRGRIFYYKDDVDEWLNASGKAVSTAQLQAKNSQGNGLRRNL